MAESPPGAPFSQPFPKIDFLTHFGRSLAHFGLPFGSPWLPFGSLLALLGSLWATFWLQLAHFGRPLAPFCSPRGSIFSLFGSPGVVFGPFLEITWKMFEKKYSLEYFSCNKLQQINFEAPDSEKHLQINLKNLHRSSNDPLLFQHSSLTTLARSGTLP